VLVMALRTVGLSGSKVLVLLRMPVWLTVLVDGVGPCHQWRQSEVCLWRIVSVVVVDGVVSSVLVGVDSLLVRERRGCLVEAVAWQEASLLLVGRTTVQQVSLVSWVTVNDNIIYNS